MNDKNYVCIKGKPKEVFDVVASTTTVCYTHFIDGKSNRVGNANIDVLCDKDGNSLKTGENLAWG